MIAIYEKKTGKELKLKYPVDAKEWLATGNYSEAKPKAKPKATPEA